jgi:hypothetical protein
VQRYGAASALDEHYQMSISVLSFLRAIFLGSLKQLGYTSLYTVNTMALWIQVEIFSPFGNSAEQACLHND